MNTNEKLIKLKVEMIKRGISAKKLAKLSGISENTLYRRLRGDSFFKLKEVKSISEVLCLSKDSVLEIFFD